MKSEHAKAAADPRIEYKVWCDEQVRQGLEDIEAGRVVSDEELQHHLNRRFKQHAGRQYKQAA